MTDSPNADEAGGAVSGGKAPIGTEGPGAGAPAAASGRKLRRTVLVLGVAALLVAVVVVVAASRGHGASASLRDNFDLPQLGGTGHVKLAEYRGQPVVVTLFASWCDNCVEELPGFATVARSLRPGVVFIGVNSLETGNGMAMAQRFDLAGSGFLLARDIGPGLSNFHDALGAIGMPVTVFYSRKGQLLKIDQGGLSTQALRSTIRQFYGLT